MITFIQVLFLVFFGYFLSRDAGISVSVHLTTSHVSVVIKN